MASASVRRMSPSRETTLEARRLLQSTTALMHSPSMPIYSATRRSRRTLSPLSHRDTIRLARRPAELPSARSVRVDVASGGGGGQLRSLSAISSVSDTSVAPRHAWWTQSRAVAQALPSLVQIYEAQVDALLDVAARYKLQMARRKARLDDPRDSSPHGTSAAFAAARVAAAAPLRALAGSATPAERAGAPATPVDPLQLEAAQVLAELRVTVCRMVQLLQRAQAAHDAQRRRASEYAEPRDTSGRHRPLSERAPPNPTALLSRYDLKYIEASPTENARARDSKTLWQGFNYVLKALTDYWRLPLPTSSDPFSLDWFAPFAACSDVHSTVFEPKRWHADEELAEFRSADIFVKSHMLGSGRSLVLNAHELALPAGAERDWHALAALLYGGARAFSARKACTNERRRAATLIAMGWRRLQIRRRAAVRQYRRYRAAATRLQRWWRRQVKAARSDPRLSTLSAAERRAARRERHRVLARERLLARRRAALKISLSKYPAYERKVVVVQALARTKSAKRAIDVLRKRKLAFMRVLREQQHRLRDAALWCQPLIRRWDEAADVMWSEYRRVVPRATAFTPASAEREVGAVTAELRASIATELDGVRAELGAIPTSAGETYHGLLAVVAHSLGVTATLQAAVDEFVVVSGAEPLGAYRAPNGAVVGDNPPRTWLFAKADELARDDERAPQYDAGVRPGPYGQHVLQALANEAHVAHAQLRAVHAARRLTARLCGVRDVLGEEAEARAAATTATLLSSITAPLDGLHVEAAIAANAAACERARKGADAARAEDAHSHQRRRRSTVHEDFVDKFASAHATTEATTEATNEATAEATRAQLAGVGGEQGGGAHGGGAPFGGHPWACQLLVGLYGHLVACGARLEAEAARLMPLRDARALMVMHEARLGGSAAVGELKAEVGTRAAYTPKLIVARIREELGARTTELGELLPHLAPAAAAFARERELREREQALHGELRLLDAIDVALARERWQLLQHERISLVGRLAFSTELKAEYKAALSALGLREGKAAAVAELRAKMVYPPSALTLRVELAPYARKPLAHGALWRACEVALVSDMSDYLGCPQDQLQIDGTDSAPDELQPGAALVTLRVATTEADRYGQPRELLEALRGALEVMGREFVLTGVADALGVAEKAPIISLHAVDFPDYTPLNVMRALREDGADARAAADGAREALRLVDAERARRFRAQWGRREERWRHQTPLLPGPLRAHKRAAEIALGRETVLAQLEQACPPREAARQARLWLPTQLDAIDAAAEAEAQGAREVVARHAAAYAQRAPLKRALRDVVVALGELHERLPPYARRSLSVRMPEPRAENGWATREAYLAEKRLVRAVAREASRLGLKARAAARGDGGGGSGGGAGGGSGGGEGGGAGGSAEDPPRARTAAGVWDAIKACMQMNARPSLRAPGALLTPEMVVQMAARLHISLRVEDDELFLLPVAVEALICPLPLGWREEPRPRGWGASADAAKAAGAQHAEPRAAKTSAAAAGAPAPPRATLPPPAAPPPSTPLRSAFIFTHELSGETREEHPMLPALAAFVDQQRRRKARARKWSHLERWMQFATADGKLVYVDMCDPLLRSTTQLPVCEAPSVRARREQRERKPPSSTKHSRDMLQLVAAQIEKERLATREARERVANAAAAAQLKTMYQRVRAQAVRLRPCALPEIMVAASALELNLPRMPELAWLPEMLVSCPPSFLPAGWFEWEDVNPLTGNARSFFANDVSALPDERSAHPFRVEVRTVHGIVRNTVLKLLHADREYLATFEQSQLLATPCEG
ncbi:hypothetical protein KFE25_003487 [Diacronema lutheri]|uniref:Uncharacterized protein n=1 Tax=Diacronema lutheri TaxID=2081491 RepID=A0A8J6C9C3_DIALT|nr:hypothetical protein KFE25_003487 [Diacronema lutheri]